jgi:hypothetical protein
MERALVSAPRYTNSFDALLKALKSEDARPNDARLNPSVHGNHIVVADSGDNRLREAGIVSLESAVAENIGGPNLVRR